VAYDAVIIGAGMSGLAAGIRLAYYQKSVCILERHTTIGGLNSFYRLRGRNYDVGLHAFTNYAKPGTKTGPLSKVLKQLRLRWEDLDLAPQTFSTVVFPGCSLRFANDIDDLTAQIGERFPAEVDGFRRLLTRVNEHEVTGLAMSGLSARAIVNEYLRDPLLIEMLLCPLLFYGSASSNDMDFNQFVIMFKSIFQEGFGRPFEGIRRLLKILVRRFKELGGELRLRAGVQSIIQRGNRAVAVVLDDGQTIETRDVVSSAGALETLHMCGLKGETPAGIRPGDITYAETIYSLDRPPAELGHPETIVFYNDCDRFTYEMPSAPLDLRSGIVCSPNNFVYGRALEENRIRITALANPAFWLGLSDQEYQQQKSIWADRLVEAALRFMPDFRKAIVDSDMFTPRTIKKFTGHLNGCVYGSADKVASGRTHLENVFLCGNDQGLLGIVGTLMSGISIANAYLLK
jgi:phytoene dehydrogenase-like protein